MPRPNLIYVFADQLGVNHCGYGGSPVARTPTIDSLSRQGVNFSNAVSTMPVCAPYRASLFTGKYPTSTGMVINELRINPDQPCFGHILRDSGYRTSYIGKWHLYANVLGDHDNSKQSFVPPGPNRLGFDEYWAGYNFHHNYYDTYYHTDTPERISYGEGVYEPDGQVDLAIERLKHHASEKEPFALFLSIGTPHDGWFIKNVPAKYYEMFENAALPDPINYKPDNDPYGDAWSTLSPEQRGKLQRWRRVYYAMVANLDDNIGRLLNSVDELGLAENTLFVLTSDHGEMFGAQGRRAKNIFYDEAARVPFLVRWPKAIPANLESDSCLGTVDILPTLCGLMDLSIPSGVEGMDLSLRARGQDGPEPSAAFMQNTGAVAIWQDGHEWRALRDKQFTYATYRVDGSELLFDNIADPFQKMNLSDDPAHKKIMIMFRKMLTDKMTALKDTFPASSWYKQNWISNDRIILRSATSEFTANL